MTQSKMNQPNPLPFPSLVTLDSASSWAYAPSRDILDKIEVEIGLYIKTMGRSPNVLFLGWGSYLSLVAAWSNKVGCVSRPITFKNCSIFLDPAYEKRVACSYHGALWSNAIALALNQCNAQNA